MSAVAERLEAPVEAPEPRRSRRRAARPRLTRGVFWIVVVGLMLVGVVAISVAVLRLNLRLDQLGQERVKLRAGNAALSAQLSSQTAAGRIQARARALGLIGAQPAQTHYVDLGPELRGR